MSANLLAEVVDLSLNSLHETEYDELVPCQASSFSFCLVFGPRVSNQRTALVAQILESHVSLR